MKTCGDPIHAQMEQRHHERSQGSFLLASRWKHAQLSHPTHSIPASLTSPSEGANTVEIEDDSVTEDFELYVVDNENTMRRNPLTISMVYMFMGHAARVPMGRRGLQEGGESIVDSDGVSDGVGEQRPACTSSIVS
jgi:hypothetical protein